MLLVYFLVWRNKRNLEHVYFGFIEINFTCTEGDSKRSLRSWRDARAGE